MNQPLNSSSVESKAQTEPIPNVDDASTPSIANAADAQSDCAGKICGGKLGSVKPLDDSLLAEALRHLSRFELDNLPLVGRQWDRVVDTLPQYRVLFEDYGVNNWESPRYANARSPIQSMLMREDPVEVHTHWVVIPAKKLQKCGARIADKLKTAEIRVRSKENDPTQTPYLVKLSFNGASMEQLEKLFDCSPRLRTRRFVLSCSDASPRRLDLLLAAAERFRPMWEGCPTQVGGSFEGNFFNAIPRLFANCPRITFEDGDRWSWQGEVPFGSVESGTNSCAAIELGAWDGIQLEHVTNYLFSGLETGGEEAVGCGGGGQKRRLEVNYFGYFNREASAFSSEILMRLIQERLASIAPQVPTFKLMINMKRDYDKHFYDGAGEEEESKKLVVDLLPEESRRCLRHSHTASSEPPQQDANQPTAAGLAPNRYTHHCTFSSQLGILKMNCLHCIPIVHIEVECGDVEEKWGKEPYTHFPEYPVVVEEAGADEHAEMHQLDEEGNSDDEEGTEEDFPHICKLIGTSGGNRAEYMTKPEPPQGEGGSSRMPMTEEEKIHRALFESFDADMEALKRGELTTNEEMEQLFAKTSALLKGIRTNEGKKQNPDDDDKNENGNDKSIGDEK